MFFLWDKPRIPGSSDLLAGPNGVYICDQCIELMCQRFWMKRLEMENDEYFDDSGYKSAQA